MMGPVCKYQMMIECSNRSRCEKCGWNPKVEKQRINKIKEQRMKLPQTNKSNLVRCGNCMYRQEPLMWCMVHDRKVNLEECCVYGMRRGKG